MNAKTRDKLKGLIEKEMDQCEAMNELAEQAQDLDMGYNLVEPKESALDTQQGGNHYKDMAIQPAVFCQKNKLPWCESNAIKYLCRWRNKNGIEDLRKAKHYIEMLIEIECS